MNIFELMPTGDEPCPLCECECGECTCEHTKCEDCDCGEDPIGGMFAMLTGL